MSTNSTSLTVNGIPILGNLPVGTGYVVHVVENVTTDPYYKRLVESGVDRNDIVSTLAAAYAKLTDDRGDTVLIYPGLYTVAATLAWDKDNTRIIGVGSPNQRNGRTAGTDPGIVAIRCSTSGVDNILNVTGDFVQIHGIDTMNTYTSNDNRCDLLVSGRNIFVSNCCFRGGNGANQLNHADGGVPVIFASGTSGAGHAARFVNCHLGNSSNDARTVGPGAVLFETGTTGFEGYFIEFIDCVFEMRCETTGSANPKLIHLAGNYCIDRYLLFKNCLFYNFWINHVGKMDYAIVDADGATHDIVIKNCTAIGIDFWSNVATHTWVDNACTTSGQGGLGGIGVVATVA